MRQDDGSELLGANDPRSATIGVIHVAPSDDRPSVLGAILTQDKLGRKQVAIVLPEGENKAFQHAFDFDGLKSMRRGLKAQIVFIAPSGPGPAEFARQRRFPVYSSLESYARALQADGQGSTAVKRSWMFGRRQKPAHPESTPPSPALSTNGVEHEPTHPLPDRPAVAAEPVFTENGAQAKSEGEQNHHGRNAALLGGAGLAAGLGLGAMAAGEHEHDSVSPPPDEDWDALPAPAAGTYAVNGSYTNGAPIKTDAPASAHPDPSSNRNGAGPEIIAFPAVRPQGRTTDKLPPAVVPVSAARPLPPVIQSPERQRNSGKIAAVGGGAAAGAGAVMVTRGSGAAAPPPPTQVGGGGGGGAAGSQRNNRRRWLALAGLILLTLLVIGGIVFAAPGGLGPHIFNGTPSATVSITPAHSDVTGSYTIDAIPGGTTGKSQVEARKLLSNKSQSGTVKATGTGHTPGVRATGTLTFYNGSFSEQTVLADTVFQTSSGVQVENTVAANIPPATGNPPTFGQVPVAAIAVNVGTSGDIAAGAINQTCCSSNSTIKVINLAAFSGGQNPTNFTIVTQSDVNSFANPLETSLLAAAKADVTNQKKANEQFVGAVSCTTPTVTSSPPVGQAASQAMVTVSVKCSGEVFDQVGAIAQAQADLKDKAAKSPGAGYALMGDIVVTNEQVSIADTQGTVALLISVKGRWVYQFSPTQLKNLAQLIAGKTKQGAINILLQQTGVDRTQAPTIDISGGGTTLPTDPNQIQIIPAKVEGFMGTPTPTAGPGTPTGPGSTATSGTTATPTPTPTPVNGLGGS